MRCFGKHQRIYDPWHYVDALERKPGELRNGAPFKNWHLPTAVSELREKLLRHSDGDKQFIQILLLAAKQGISKVEEACAISLNEGLTVPHLYFDI